jgi:hypothetical protein
MPTKFPRRRTKGARTLMRLTRHLAVGTASLLLVASSAAYVLSPMQAALAARLSSVPSRPHREAIEGRLQVKRARGFIVEVIARHGRRERMLAIVHVGRSRRFDVRVRPGRYLVVIRHGHEVLRHWVRVAKDRSAFIVVKLSRRRDGISLVPVIFNY